MSNILIAVVIAAQVGANTPAVPLLRGEELMRALQSGGYTILLRHARTDQKARNKETPGETPALRADQRNLTADGEQDVRLMRAVVEKYRFPISEVLSSPVYRCRETADAFGTPAITATLRKIPMTAETQALVAAAPQRGTNRVLVTHHFVIEKYVPGITPGAIAESEAAVVRPVGDGTVALVGKIALADWQMLAGDLKAEAPAAAETAPAVAVPIPSTRAGNLASRYLEAYNSGDPARMRSFIERWMVALPDRPTEARLQSYAKMLSDFGSLTVTGIQSASDDAIVLGARAKTGNLVITVKSSAQTDRLESLTIGMAGGHP